ncbi:putative membrane protein, partial [Erysiphe neolycopersici]
MVSKANRNPHPPTRPSIYNEDGDIMKKSIKDLSGEFTRKFYRRSASLGSNTAALNQVRKENLVDVNDTANLADLASKPLFHEILFERGGGNETDRGRSRVRNLQSEEPYVFGGGRRNVDDDYLNPHYDRYTRRRVQRYYSPPRQRSPTRNGSLRDRTPNRDALRTGWSNVRHTLREPLAEFFGVFILVLFGDGSIAQVVLSNNTRGEWQSICWGWGLGIMLGVYASSLSGANINPAVTFTNCIFRQQPWYKLPIYAAAQIFGAFCAAGVVYGNYKNAIDVFEGGEGVRTVPGFSSTATAGIFATYPQDFVSRTTEFFNEFIAAAILMFCIYMLQDKKNMGAGKLLPLAL